jgi:hypothetical protein
MKMYVVWGRKPEIIQTPTADYSSSAQIPIPQSPTSPPVPFTPFDFVPPPQTPRYPQQAYSQPLPVNNNAQDQEVPAPVDDDLDMAAKAARAYLGQGQ